MAISPVVLPRRTTLSLPCFWYDGQSGLGVDSQFAMAKPNSVLGTSSLCRGLSSRDAYRNSYRVVQELFNVVMALLRKAHEQRRCGTVLIDDVSSTPTDPLLASLVRRGAASRS